MNEKKERRIYKPPQVKSLSDLIVKGDGPGPLGICAFGNYPWESCVQGFFYTEVNTDCKTGNTPTGPSCMLTGSTATNTCDNGTVPG